MQVLELLELETLLLWLVEWNKNLMLPKSC